MEEKEAKNERAATMNIVIVGRVITIFRITNFVLPIIN